MGKRKVYRYRDISVPVADNDVVTITVQFISDGNTGPTIVNIPGEDDPDRLDAGEIELGKGKDLREPTTISISDITNLASEETYIRVNYKINGSVIAEHENKKEDATHATIMLFIKFPEP
ncbi:MAG: hypothetical protein ACJA1C_002169 [Crocinitomicaceae bacterium]|jgi:hypothetical protein